MPRKPIDYTNTHFYKIVCKDTNIKSLYIGHTTDFTKRKNKHKRLSNDTEDKQSTAFVYTFIRDNGGWENWEMILIETKTCENSLEAKKIEREFIDNLEADLNIVRPFISDEERTERARDYRQAYYKENKEDILCKVHTYYLQNKDNIIDKKTQYRKEHREQVNEQQRLYCCKNKEHILKQRKKYEDKNREAINKRQRTYYANNRDRLRLYEKERYDKRKEEILSSNQERITCECGIEICKGAYTRHLKSKHHQVYEKSLIENND